MAELDVLYPLTRFSGMRSDVEAELISDDLVANALNADFSSLGGFASDLGYSKLGNTTQTADRVIACPKESIKLRDGSTIDIKVVDDGSTATILWLNTNKITNHEDGEWETLIASWATGKKVWFAPFNTTSENRVFISNGVQNLSYWNCSTTYLTADLAGGEATISVADTTNFAASGTIIIGGTAVTYTGKTGTTFTGCASTPAASTNDGVAQQADTSTLSAAPKIKNMKTIGGRLFGSVDTRLYGSAIGDGTNWTIPSPVTLSSPFVRDFPEGDGNITSIDRLHDYTIIGKPGRILSYKQIFTDSTLAPQEVIEELDGDFGPASDNFVKLDSSALAYVTADGYVRMIQMNQQNDRLTASPLNDFVLPQMKNGNYDQCEGIFHRKEKTLLYTFKKSSASAYNDYQLKVQFFKDETGTTVPRLSFKNWPANCFSISSGRVLFHGSFDKESYHGFDGYTADGSPFTSLVTSKRVTLIDRVREANVLYMPVTGYVQPGGVLKFELDYDIFGTRAHLEATFDSQSETDYIIAPAIKTIGAFEIGSEPIGGNLVDINDLLFFRIFFVLPERHNPYDMQLTVYQEGIRTNSDTQSVDVTGNRFKITFIGIARVPAETRVDNKLKKNFNLV